jgi:hypothetical protein
MNRLTRALLMLGLFAAPMVRADAWLSADDTARSVEALIEAARSDNPGYEILTSLTTEVGPRLAGTPAEARARDWAVAKMKDLGLANVRIEPFNVPLWLRGVEKAEIVAPFPQPLVITALGGSASTGPDGVEGEVVAFESLAALEAASPDSVAGRIVFVDEPMARTRDGAGYGVAVKKRHRTAFAAQRLGALGALIRSVGTNSHRFAHTGQMQNIDYDAAQGAPAAALSAPDADQLARALAYGKPVTVRMTLTPELRPPALSGNVIGEIVGSEAPQEVVLISAHLDSWDLGTGAVDDGAGVGVVLGAVAVLKEHIKTPPRRTIRVVLFGSEEVGLIGAEAYNKAYAEQLVNHVIAVESDFGAGDIWRFDTHFAETSLGVGEQLAAHLAPLGIAPGNNEAAGGPDLSFLRESGVPVVELLQDGTDYFDLHHTPNDTLDKVAPDALDQNVAAYAAFTYLVANSSATFR